MIHALIFAGYAAIAVAFYAVGFYFVIRGAE